VKILLLDIETAPHLAHVWGCWQQNVGMNQMIEPGYMLCWAAKWLGESEVYFGSLRKGQGRMVKEIHALMSEADAICTYNGNKFDLPTLNKEILMSGLQPPPPSKSVDLLRVVKQRFRFPMNKLDYVARQLGLGSKVAHEGHELWIKCMAGDDAAWRRMCSYNVQDVRLLEKLFEKLRPWIKTLPNAGLHNPDTAEVCPKCGSDTFQRRGMAHTGACSYQRFQCCKCSGWFRSTRNIGPKAGNKFANV
jgi:DNA polymerase elongation subunit (family B)